MSSARLHEQLDSLAELQDATDEAAFIEEQASTLAEDLFDNSQEQEDFSAELADWHDQAQAVNVILVYNPGGFGGGDQEGDPEWPSVLEGIQEHLEQEWGYASAIVEHARAEYSASGFIKAMDDMRNEYASTALVLAAKLGFLMKYNAGLKIIITGRSFGAVFANEVMNLLPEADSLYSVQAGRYARYSPSPASDERTLLIDDNGTGPDAWSDGDLWAIIRANMGHVPSTSPPEEGSLQILNWYFVVPGHAYTWDHPGVYGSIVAFLDEVIPGQ
jgi:hypothetical protein